MGTRIVSPARFVGVLSRFSLSFTYYVGRRRAVSFQYTSGQDEEGCDFCSENATVTIYYEVKTDNNKSNFNRLP